MLKIPVAPNEADDALYFNKCNKCSTDCPLFVIDRNCIFENVRVLQQWVPLDEYKDIIGEQDT